MSESRLTISGGEQRLVLDGEVDADSAPALAEALAAAQPEGQIDLVMHDVSFIDSSGLRVLLEAHQRTQEAGGALVLERPSNVVVRLLEISGLEQTFRVVSGDDTE